MLTVSIPQSVTSIEVGVFSSCDRLTSITVNSNNAYYSASNGVLFNKNKSVIVQYPARLSDASYTIPSSVTTIGQYAFSSAHLTSLIIPNSVTKIDKYAFYHSSIDNFTIPDSITCIEEGAFSFSGFTCLTIPSSVTSIGDQTFRGSFSLESINVNAGNPVFSSSEGILFNKSMSVLVAYPSGKLDAYYTIPSCVNIINDWAFSLCHNLIEVDIPSNVTMIGNGGFQYCSNLVRVNM